MKYIYIIHFVDGEIAFSSLQKARDYMWNYFHRVFMPEEAEEAEELCSEMDNSIKENKDKDFGFELECGIYCDMIEFKG